MKTVYPILRQIVNLIPSGCWPKFKVRLLERTKLDSFGRAKLDTRPVVNVDADHSVSQAPFIAHPIAIPNSLSLDCSGNAPTAGADSSPDPSLRESQPSPHRSQQDVTSHSPRQDASHQAKPPRRRTIPPLLSCDCRLQPPPQNRLFRTDISRGFVARRDSSGRVWSQGHKSPRSRDVSRATRSS